MRWQLLYLCLLVATSAASNVKFTALKCRSYNPKLILIDLCKLDQVQRDIIEMSVRAKIVRPPLVNATLNVEVMKRGTKLPLMEISVDCCDFLNTRRGNYVARMLYEFLDMRKYSNLNHSCPYDHDLVWERFRLNAKQLKRVRFLPTGSYNIISKWWINNEFTDIIELSFDWVNDKRY